MLLEDVDLLLGRGVKEPGFQYSINCVVSLYRRLLSPITTDTVGKVAVSLLPLTQRPRASPLQILDTVEIEQQFDFPKYWSLTIHSRKRAAIDVFHLGLLKVATCRGWDCEPFKLAHARAISRDLDTTFFWDRKVTRDDRTAKLFCDFGTQQIEVWIVLMKQDEEICRERLVTLKPAELFLYIVLGEFRWIADDKITLSARTNDTSWEISVAEEDRLYVRRSGAILPGEISQGA